MTGVAILKMRRGSHKYVSTIIPFISEIKSENVLVHTIRTTATIHQAYRHLKVRINQPLFCLLPSPVSRKLTTMFITTTLIRCLVLKFSKQRINSSFSELHSFHTNHEKRLITLELLLCSSVAFLNKIKIDAAIRSRNNIIFSYRFTNKKN